MLKICMCKINARYNNAYRQGVQHLSRIVRKPAFCICDNKDADQLPGNSEAAQCLCFHYTYSTIRLISKSNI